METDGRQYRAGEQAHGDALAALERLENEHYHGDPDYNEADLRAHADFVTVRQALTASGVPYVPESRDE